MIRLAPLALLALVGCGDALSGPIPIYLGDKRVGVLPGTGTPTAAPTANDQCMQLALRAADPAITDAQRRAAAEYRASIGCPTS